MTEHSSGERESLPTVVDLTRAVANSRRGERPTIREAKSTVRFKSIANLEAKSTVRFKSIANRTTSRHQELESRYQHAPRATEWREHKEILTMRICRTFTEHPTRTSSLAILSIVPSFGCGNRGSDGTTVVEPPNEDGTSTTKQSL